MKKWAGWSLSAITYKKESIFDLMASKLILYILAFQIGLLIGAPCTSLSAGGTGSLLVAKAPAGSPLPRTPAGVFVPSAPINRVPKLIICLNIVFSI
jgi:hypothetical protein